MWQFCFSKRKLSDTLLFSLILKSFLIFLRIFWKYLLMVSWFFKKKRLIFLLIFEKKPPVELLILYEKLLISKSWIWQPWICPFITPTKNIMWYAYIRFFFQNKEKRKMFSFFSERRTTHDKILTTKKCEMLHLCLCNKWIIPKYQSLYKGNILPLRHTSCYYYENDKSNQEKERKRWQNTSINLCDFFFFLLFFNL